MVAALRRLGWTPVPGSKGSHVQLKHPTRGGRVTVPIHKGQTLGPGLVASILTQAGITAEELIGVL
ncbi:MAG TPA: type II toxin-antitoxin system HicA family toxin [Chloroflexota bacterium]|nr:type II toxin-antitoxin system HicA family toxin [Chloroflexota bacterium]